jgi:hypothetical protein
MLRAVYQKMLYPDVMVIAQGQKFLAHKGILAARCKFFESLFISKKIIFNSTDPQVVQVIQMRRILY